MARPTVVQYGKANKSRHNKAKTAAQDVFAGMVASSSPEQPQSKLRAEKKDMGMTVKSKRLDVDPTEEITTKLVEYQISQREDEADEAKRVEEVRTRADRGYEKKKNVLGKSDGNGRSSPRVRKMRVAREGNEENFEDGLTTPAMSRSRSPRRNVRILPEQRNNEEAGLRRSPRRSKQTRAAQTTRDPSVDTTQQATTTKTRTRRRHRPDEPLTKPDTPTNPLNSISSPPASPLLPDTHPSIPSICTTHCGPLLNLSTHPHITPFSIWTSELTPHFHITKIAEASFGEVYRLSLLHQIDDLTNTDESVFKVIALKPPPFPIKKKATAAEKRKLEAMSCVEDVANEVKLLLRMGFIPGFTNFRDVRVLKGRPTGGFIGAWREFDRLQKEKGKEGSVFGDPGRKTTFSEEQLWAVVEMQDAGVDLERLLEEEEEENLVKTIWGVWDVFWGVVLSLAKGEHGAEFEHRDLHLGNICVRFRPGSDRERIDHKRKLGFTGVETTIIDYTISRCSVPKDDDPQDVEGTEKEADIAWHDLSTPSEQYLFEADATHEYQYEIYRYMRSAVFFGTPLEDFEREMKTRDTTRRKTKTKTKTKNPEEGEGEGEKDEKIWRAFHPITNIVWLHFLLFKLLEGIPCWPSETPTPETKREIKIWKRARELEGALGEVRDFLLCPEVIGKGARIPSRTPGGDERGEMSDDEGDDGDVQRREESKIMVLSASDLAFWATDRGWLDVSDLAGGDPVEDDGERLV